MLKESHLSLHETDLPAGSEWRVRALGWWFLRLKSGVGYWLGRGQNVELSGDQVVVVPGSTNGVLAISQLGTAVLHSFRIDPERLSGLLSVGDRQSLTAGQVGREAVPFAAGHPVAVGFRELAESIPVHPFILRCRLLELFAQALLLDLKPMEPTAPPADAQDRLQKYIRELPEQVLMDLSLTGLSRDLHCSPRHLSRLLRQELGVPLRTKQTELRLERARALLLESDAKIINVALDCGYRHLGLFNALFKKRFGIPPSELRRCKPREKPEASVRLRSSVLTVLCLALFVCGTLSVRAQNKTEIAQQKADPVFAVDRYDVTGNTVLPTAVIESVTRPFTGETTSFETIRRALGALQLEYRERGYVSVAVSLPPQQVTNRLVRVQVTEGRLVAVEIQHNRYFSAANIRRALPGLHTNELLNSKLFQAELDLANNNRDRQIYPRIQPGPDPGTTALVLDVKDRLPLHGRLEFNNQNPPGTPALRTSASAQYNNLWNLEHTLGLQYGWSPEAYRQTVDLAHIYDAPLIANYSAFYRFPIGAQTSVPEQIEANPGRFGFDEATRKFKLPASSGRSELNLYANRFVSDTGVKYTEARQVAPPPFAIFSQDTGEDQTVTEGLGLRWTKPLPEIARIRSTLSAGFDLKHFTLASYNTNNFRFRSEIPDEFDPTKVTVTETFQSSAQPARSQALTYVPMALRWDAGLPDATGTTSFGLGLSANVAGGPFSDAAEFAKVAGSTNATGTYVTAALSLGRDQQIYKDWRLVVRADGQWANEPLISNEQYSLGGLGGVRGYNEGARFGDTGWRITSEVRSPSVSLKHIQNGWAITEPIKVRGVAFMDYGRSYLLNPGGRVEAASLWGAGFGTYISCGELLDIRFLLAWPLAENLNSTGSMRIYFGAGLQF